MLENLKKLREAAGTTQSALAAAIGVSQQSINKYENHSIEPDIETLKRMADFFDTTIDYIVGRSECRYKPENMQKYALNDDEAALMRSYRRLTSQQRAALYEVARAFDHE